MYHIGLGFKHAERKLRGEYVTSRGLHGILYRVLREADARGATWLHSHDSPKPYTLTPYYDTTNATLAGIRLSAVNAQTADLITHAWESAMHEGRELNLGKIPFTVRDVVCVNGTSFESLSILPPENTVTLRFLSPTTFKQGKGHLPLPVPANVFRQPFRVWNAFAPSRLRIPSDWLDWCFKHVYIKYQQIETADVVISPREPLFTGFVGEVTFEARSDALMYLSLFQALAHLTKYSGVGYKTTMGMGACEVIGVSAYE